MDAVLSGGWRSSGLGSRIGEEGEEEGEEKEGEEEEEEEEEGRARVLVWLDA